MLSAKFQMIIFHKVGPHIVQLMFSSFLLEANANRLSRLSCRRNVTLADNGWLSARMENNKDPGLHFSAVIGEAMAAAVAGQFGQSCRPPKLTRRPG